MEGASVRVVWRKNLAGVEGTLWILHSTQRMRIPYGIELQFCRFFPSLEPGPSRARYFPRDMLLLTTTARERAWRLLKITSPLIGWFDGDSPIPGISPWLAPLSRCTLYIVEVQRTLCSCLFVFEIRTVGWHQPCILP